MMNGVKRMDREAKFNSKSNERYCLSIFLVLFKTKNNNNIYIRVYTFYRRVTRIFYF